LKKLLFLLLVVFVCGCGGNKMPTPITTAAQLAAISLTGNYIQMNDIDLSGYSNWTPIGEGLWAFAGTYDGGSHKITGLTTSASYGGLFAYLDYGGTIQNVNLVSPSVINVLSGTCGSLIGEVEGGNITNCTATSVNVNGGYEAGGLVGYAGFARTTFTNCSVAGAVYSAQGAAGGIVGLSASGSYAGAVFTNCNFTGTITSGTSGYASGAGGIIGTSQWNQSTYDTLNGCWANATVHAQGYAGGLIGYAKSVHIFECYSLGATGNIYGTPQGGGLIGLSTGGQINNCYSHVNNTSSGFIGASSSDTITYCYSTGTATAYGFCNSGSSTVTGCYYDEDTAGIVAGAGTPEHTAAMKTQATYSGWNFTSLWTMTEGVTYPYFGVAPVNVQCTVTQILIDAASGKAINFAH
jgi:hypothetical protein